MTRFAAAAFFLLIAVSPLAAVAAPAPPPTTEAEAQARLDAFSRDLAAFAQPYNDAMLRAETLVLTLIDGSTKVIEDHTAEGDEAERRAWLQDWSAKVRAEVVALKTLKAALPPAPDAAFDKLGTGSDPSIVKLRGAFRDLPAASDKLFASVFDMTEASLPLIERGVAGDGDALFELSQQLLAGLVVSLEAENVMQDISIVSTPTHPQAAGARSIKASNEAMIAILDAQRLEMAGEEIDRRALIETIRAKARVSRTAAAEMAGRAATTSAAADTIPASSAFKLKIKAAYATYATSGETETALATLLSQVADRIEQGDDIADAMGDQAQFNALVDKRVALQQERLRLLAQ